MQSDIWEGVNNEMGRTKRKIIKGIVLFLIITFGVACGNLISTVIIAKSAEMALNAGFEKRRAEEALAKERLRIESEKVMAEAKERMQELNARNKKAMDDANRAAEAYRREQEHQQQVQKKLNETCQFWRNEYNKTRKELDKIHRDNACKAAGM
ncbi:MAG: hypothetical protein WA987_05880 [Cellvibrio sp.]